MNKKIIELIAIVGFMVQLNGAENATLKELKAQKAQLEKSYASSMSVLFGVISAGTLGMAGYGIGSSLRIFSNMPNKVPFSEKGRPLGFPADMPRPSFWQTFKETYTGVIPFYFGSEASASREFIWADYHINRLSVLDQSTLAFGFGAPVLTAVGMLSAVVSRYLYKKAASYKKEIEEINQKIKELSNKKEN